MNHQKEKALAHSTVRPKRIAIYVIYDKDGILDSFRKYYLTELNRVVDYVLAMVCGTLTPESRDELEKIVDEICVRENKGLLAGAWVDGIAHIGWDTLDTYDELFMLNDSFFGPFYPLEDMMDAMEKSDADFYGAMRNFEDKNITDLWGHRPRHGYVRGSICYFYIIRPRLLHSSEFKSYWSKMPEIQQDGDTYFYAEINFYDFVVDAGFKIDTYQSEKYRHYMFNNLTHNMQKLVSEEKIPFARIRPFTNDLLFEELTIGYGKDPRKTLEHISLSSNYNTNYIWDYILRTKNLFSVFNQLQLEYVVPKYTVEKNFNNSIEMPIAAIIHIYYEDQIKKIIAYCRNFPKGTDFYVTTDSKIKRQRIEAAFCEYGLKATIKVRPNVGAAMASLWVTYSNIIKEQNYVYICYFHDKKSPYSEYEVVGQQFAERCYENLFGTPTIIKNILNLFEENPKLGIISGPEPYHGYYFTTLINSWTNNYETAKELADEMNLKVDIRPDIPPKAPLGDMFWFRTRAFQKIPEMNYTYQDFNIKYKSDGTKLHAIERLYAYIAQNEGYFFAEVINSDEARSDLVNYRYIINNLLWAIVSSGAYPTSLCEATSYILNGFDSRKHLARIKIKQRIKRKVPKTIWNFFKRVYHFLGGKRWVG